MCKYKNLFSASKKNYLPKHISFSEFYWRLLTAIQAESLIRCSLVRKLQQVISPSVILTWTLQRNGTVVINQIALSNKPLYYQKSVFTGQSRQKLYFPFSFSFLRFSHPLFTAVQEGRFVKFMCVKYLRCTLCTIPSQNSFTPRCPPAVVQIRNVCL